MSHGWIRLARALCVASLLCSTLAEAQSPDPRDYEVAFFVPSKTVLANTYLRHQTATEASDYTANIAIFRGTFILKFGDLAITPLDVILPVLDQRAYVPLSRVLGGVNPAFGAVPSDFKLTTHAAGLGDMLLLPTIGHGVRQNPENNTHTWYGVTTYIRAPTGAYDADKPLNVGQNRWSVMPLLFLGQRFLRVVTLEAQGSVAFHMDNDAYRYAAAPELGNQLVLKQEPSFGAATHLAVDLHKSFFVGLSYMYQMNGRQDFQTPGATPQTYLAANQTRVHTMRLNFGIRVAPTTLILVQWNEDLDTEDTKNWTATGATRSRFFGLRFSHAFFRAPPAPPGAAAQ